MADWNDPKVCVLITPTVLNAYPGWASLVQKLTEEGRLRRHYIRFGGKQKKDVREQIMRSTANVSWKIIRETPAYILVQVTHCPFKPDPEAPNAA